VRPADGTGKPLHGVRVVDFTHHLPGPYATDLLARLGAEVVKVEPPQGDPARWLPPFDGDFGRLFTLLNRGKRSVVVDLSDSEGVRFVHRLAATADVVVDSWRPGTAEKLSVDASTLRRINPRLVCCSISAFGSSSPRSAHDANCAALAGLCDLQRDSGGRVILPAVQLGDMGGAVYAALLIVSALFDRETTGEGRVLDVSMLDAARSLMPSAEALYRDSPDPQTTFFLSGSLPSYDVYRTADGRELMVASLESHFWERFCTAISRPHLIPLHHDPASHERVRQEIGEAIAARSLEQWEAVFREVDACVEPVLTVDESHERFGPVDRNDPLSRNLGAYSGEVDPLGAGLAAVAVEIGYDSAEVKSLQQHPAFTPRKDLARRMESDLRWKVKPR
jgi:crotonobetainyl-CoA:carnitine CoA-transferase CaiB-like acyl-CoA transferase